jgi:hypothetical protein
LLAAARSATLGRMLELLGVTLLQPEPVIAARVPGGANAIGALLASVQEALGEVYAATTAPGSRTLCIALGPERPLQVWLATDDDVAVSDEEARVRELTRNVEVPEVLDGPVAFAVVFAIGAEAPAEAQLTLPDEWRSIVAASDTTVSVEQIITRIWASN